MAETQTQTNPPGPNDPHDPTKQDVAMASAGSSPYTDSPMDPEGQVAQEAQQAEGQGAGLPENMVPKPGIGIEGEFTVWEGRYSMKNFVGGLILRLLATGAWFVLAYFTWAQGAISQPLQMLAIITAVLLGLYWLALVWRVVKARFSHFYRLTNKRLFVWSGIFKRRLDQLELVKVNDVYTSEPSLWHRWFKVGTVVVESSEEQLPMTYLNGVNQPVQVMDTVWHTSRAEREGHTVRVDEV